MVEQVMRGRVPPPIHSGSTALRRKVACEGSGEPCEKCKAEQEGELRRKAASAVTSVEAPPIVHQVLRSPGQPLAAATRAFFEAHFGHDFSQVRVHANSDAAASARAINAYAYTVGADLVFAQGQFAPEASEGKRILAHELTHVVQQEGAQAILQRQLATPMTPTTNQDRREFIQGTIDFFNRSADYFRDKQVPINQALFERLINSWYLMVIDRERMIDSNLGGDAALKNELHAAYTASIRVLISRAAIVFKESENELYQKNSGRIPMWAWPTPHHLEPGISTPIAQGRGIDVVTGNVMFAINGFDVTIVPDTIDNRLGNRAKTGIDLHWHLPGYQWKGRQRRITSFNAPPPVTVRIQTKFGPNVTATSSSGYGRGTTPEDIAGGRVTSRSISLGFHEGSHGLAFVAFLEANPAPRFTGRVGMTETQFRAAITQWERALRNYSRRIKAFSMRRVDCVGTTIDQFDQARAAAGVAVRIVCGRP